MVLLTFARRRKLGMLVFVFALSVFCSTVLFCNESHAIAENQSHAHEQMTSDQIELMQTVGEGIVERIDELFSQYRSELSAFDRFYWNCLSDHMWDLHFTDDWESFRNSLNNCDSPEAFSAILDSSFKGITTAHEGYLSKGEVFEIAKDILISAKCSDEFVMMVAIPKSSYGASDEAWRVFFASADDSHAAYIKLLPDGSLLEFYRHVSINGDYD